MHKDQVLGILSTVQVKAGREDDYHQALMNLIRDHSTREPDCIDIVVHRRVDDPTQIMLYERWRITRERFVSEQMSKPFIKDFTERTRKMVVADEEVTYWSSIDLVAEGEHFTLAGAADTRPSN
jgi:quinol monooxygenase YgiN